MVKASELKPGMRVKLKTVEEMDRIDSGQLIENGFVYGLLQGHRDEAGKEKVIDVVSDGKYGYRECVGLEEFRGWMPIACIDHIIPEEGEEVGPLDQPSQSVVLSKIKQMESLDKQSDEIGRMQMDLGEEIKYLLIEPGKYHVPGFTFKINESHRLDDYERVIDL